MCRSGDRRLADCSHGGIGKHNCGHLEDVGLNCTSSKSLVLVFQMPVYP